MQVESAGVLRYMDQSDINATSSIIEFLIEALQGLVFKIHSFWFDSSRIARKIWSISLPSDPLNRTYYPLGPCPPKPAACGRKPGRRGDEADPTLHFQTGLHHDADKVQGGGDKTFGSRTGRTQ